MTSGWQEPVPPASPDEEGFEQRVLARTAELIAANQRLEREVSERRRVERELAEARDQAVEASLAKSTFLANMSHEIRTPLTAILGYAELLLDVDQTTEERTNAVEVIRQNGSHLLSILNDVLDLSKIEAGKMTVERIPCSPIQIVSEVASLMRLRAIEKNLDFKVEFVGPIPETIQTDPTRVRQIFLNVVTNALKFTQEGSVRLVTSLLDQPDEGKPILCFEVIDTGI